MTDKRHLSGGKGGKKMKKISKTNIPKNERQVKQKSGAGKAAGDNLKTSSYSFRILEKR